ncbi:MAG: NAD kinase [Proteobacteria bacterium]|nr:NAD kinase [Pseudomonadota bacterium]
MVYKKIGYIADFESEVVAQALEELAKSYDLCDAQAHPPDYCDVIITLGGDGVMLKALHYVMGYSVPVFGMNRGSIGFLLNEFSKEKLIERLEQAAVNVLHPLEMRAITAEGTNHRALAVNEVSLLRETSQTAKIKISINHETQLDCLVSDGVLVSTPAGSSAYNFAAYGPIIPLDARILALTPISPFRPKRWRGALLHCGNEIQFDILEPEKRPVSAVADSTEVRDVISVVVKERSDISMQLLFDPGNVLAERVLKEQFAI